MCSTALPITLNVFIPIYTQMCHTSHLCGCIYRQCVNGCTHAAHRVTGVPGKCVGHAHIVNTFMHTSHF